MKIINHIYLIDFYSSWKCIRKIRNQILFGYDFHGIWKFWLLNHESLIKRFHLRNWLLWIYDIWYNLFYIFNVFKYAKLRKLFWIDWFLMSKGTLFVAKHGLVLPFLPWHFKLHANLHPLFFSLMWDMKIRNLRILQTFLFNDMKE